jgi:hypothetical protein
VDKLEGGIFFLGRVPVEVNDEIVSGFETHEEVAFIEEGNGGYRMEGQCWYLVGIYIRISRDGEGREEFKGRREKGERRRGGGRRIEKKPEEGRGVGRVDKGEGRKEKGRGKENREETRRKRGVGRVDKEKEREGTRKDAKKWAEKGGHTQKCTKLQRVQIDTTQAGTHYGHLLVDKDRGNFVRDC